MTIRLPKLIRRRRYNKLIDAPTGSVGFLLQSGSSGYDEEHWVESTELEAAQDMEAWITRLNNDAANADGVLGESSRAVIESSARIVRESREGNS